MANLMFRFNYEKHELSGTSPPHLLKSSICPSYMNKDVTYLLTVDLIGQL
jgi:hypothetical protein